MLCIMCSQSRKGLYAKTTYQPWTSEPHPYFNIRRATESTELPSTDGLAGAADESRDEFYVEELRLTIHMQYQFPDLMLPETRLVSLT
jgi:hypothetical protein